MLCTMFFLVADDNDGKRLMLEGFVKRSMPHAHIVRAATTDEAKRMIDAHSIDCAFIDYEMPTENGPAVITYLKEKNPSARIALVTAFDGDRYHDEALAAGAEAFVTTSHGSDELAQTLQNLLMVWATEL